MFFGSFFAVFGVSCYLFLFWNFFAFYVRCSRCPFPPLVPGGFRSLTYKKCLRLCFGGKTADPHGELIALFCVRTLNFTSPEPSFPQKACQGTMPLLEDKANRPPPPFVELGNFLIPPFFYKWHRESLFSPLRITLPCVLLEGPFSGRRYLGFFSPLSGENSSVPSFARLL